MSQSEMDSIEEEFQAWWRAEAYYNWDYNRLGIARAAYRAGREHQQVKRSGERHGEPQIKKDLSKATP